MNPMGHDIPNVLGVDQTGVEEKVQELLPGYMAMGEKGMHEHLEHSKHMKGPENTLPMMAGDGPFGPIGMGGMFTILKVHEDAPLFKTAAEYTKEISLPDAIGWYKNPTGTVADIAPGYERKPDTSGKVYVCLMHPEVKQDKPGSCPKCGMTLKSETDIDQSSLSEEKTKKIVYTCPMHPDVHQDTPGTCGKCGMNLGKKQ